MKDFVAKHILTVFILAAVLFCVFTFACHLFLQQERYYSPLNHIIKTYDVTYNSDGSRKILLAEKPYTSITAEKTLVWDSQHYFEIKEGLYKYEDGDRWSNYTFFPLFPLLWKALGVDGIGIGLFNWVLYCIGLVFIYFIFKEKISKWMLFLIFCIPMSVVYMIPYTESLFFLCISAGLYGIVRNNYPVYFIGFFFAAMTRSSASIFFVAFLFLSVIDYLKEKNIKKCCIDFLKKFLPVLLGVFAVMIIQKLNGAPRWFYFIETQKFWGKYLSLPSLPFTDWSEESRCITTPFLIMYFLPCVVITIREFVFAIKQNNKKAMTSWQYVRMLSLLYLAGNIIIVIFTQHGSLNSLARYMLCTPFLVFLLLDTASGERKRQWRLVYLLIGVITVLMSLRHFSRINGVGIYLVMLTSLIVFFNTYIPKKILYILLALAIAVNIFWTSYMYNSFLLNSWIFT